MTNFDLIADDGDDGDDGDGDGLDDAVDSRVG